MLYVLRVLVPGCLQVRSLMLGPFILKTFAKAERKCCNVAAAPCLPSECEYQAGNLHLLYIVQFAGCVRLTLIQHCQTELGGAHCVWHLEYKLRVTHIFYAN